MSNDNSTASSQAEEVFLHPRHMALDVFLQHCHKRMHADGVIVPELPFLLPSPRLAPYIPRVPVRLKHTRAIVDIADLSEHMKSSRPRVVEAKEEGTSETIFRCPRTNAILETPVRYHKIRRHSARVSRLADAMLRWCEGWLELADILAVLVDVDVVALSNTMEEVIQLISEVVEVRMSCSSGKNADHDGTSSSLSVQEIWESIVSRLRERMEQMLRDSSIVCEGAGEVQSEEEETEGEEERTTAATTADPEVVAVWRKRRKLQIKEITARVVELKSGVSETDQREGLVELISEVQSWDSHPDSVVDALTSKLLFSLWVRLAKLESDASSERDKECANCCFQAAFSLWDGQPEHPIPPWFSKRWRTSFVSALERCQAMDSERVDSWRLHCLYCVQLLAQTDEDGQHLESALLFAERMKRADLKEGIFREEEGKETELLPSPPLLSLDAECQLMCALHRSFLTRDLDPDPRFGSWLEHRLFSYLEEGDEESVVHLTQTDDRGDGLGDAEPDVVMELTKRLLGDLKRRRDQVVVVKKSSMGLLKRLDDEEVRFQAELAGWNQKIAESEEELRRIDHHNDE